MTTHDQLVITKSHDSDNAVRTIDLEDNGWLIGGPGYKGGQANYILLDSRLVASPLVVINRDDEGWWITRVGEGDPALMGRTLVRDLRTRFKLKSRLEVGDFTITLVGGEKKETIVVTEIDEKEIVAFEDGIHGRLLELMRGRYSDLESLEARAEIDGYVRNLTEEALRVASRALIDEIARLAFYRRLTSLIAASGEGRKVGHPEEVDLGAAEFERRVARIEMGVVSHLKLVESSARVLNPKRMDENIRRLDAGFDSTYRAFHLEFDPGLKRYLAHSHICRNIHNLIYGLGPLEDFMNMENITEIMVVSKDEIFIEKSGLIENAKRSFHSNKTLMAVIERIVQPIQRRVDMSSPMVDGRLKEGHRVNVIIPPLAKKGPCLTIRKFRKDPVTITDLIESFDSLTPEMATFLKACVELKRNILISGGTGTGKTTMLNCLSSFIPPKERIVTIEDTAELQLQQKHVVTLEARPANQEGGGATSIQDLVRNALRMRPDRIVVGECRGEETLDMLQAMNTGHDGSLTTAHANSPEDMMLRLETMVLEGGKDIPVSAIREQIAAAIHIVIQLTRFFDGHRRVTSISEVMGIDRHTGSIMIDQIFSFREAERSSDDEGDARSNGRFVRTGHIPSFIGELLDSGLADMDLFSNRARGDDGAREGRRRP